MYEKDQIAIAIYNKILERTRQLPDIKDNILVQKEGPRMNIKFNRPKRYNAFTLDMYFTLTDLIKEAGNNEQIKFIVLTGEGGNFSSGNDLANFSSPIIADLGDQEDIFKAVSIILGNLTEAIIKSKKPIIALVEGKIIGFTFTMLPLLDKVFAVESSQFIAPLVSSGQGPELCASYTFPKIFGKNIAEDLVTFGKIVNADFMEKFNLVEKCKTKKEAENKLNEYLNKIDELDWYSYINARRLYKEREEKILIEVNQREMANLVQRWINPNLMMILAKHMERMKRSTKL